MLEELIKQKIKTELKPFQIDDVRTMMKRHYWINGNDMGLGKTVECMTVQALTGLKTIVVCPLLGVYNWAQQIETHYRNPPSYIVIDSKKDVEHAYLANPDYIIVNYDKLGDVRDLFAGRELFIFDESHNLKSPTAKRTLLADKYLYEFAPQRAYLLSGTCIENAVDEIYQQLKMCSYDPKQTNGVDITRQFPNLWVFREMFMKARRFRIKGREIKKYEGLRNLPLLKQLMEGKYGRKLKVDYLKELPGKTYLPVLVSFEDDEDLLEEWEAFNSGAGKDSKAKRNSALATVPFTVKYLEQLFESGLGPLVVFSDHPDAAKAIHQAISKKHRAALITSEVTASKRQTYVDHFQAGVYDVIIGTIGTMNTTYTITRANHCVFNDRSWVPGKNDQAEDRLNRIGQTVLTTIHNVYGSKTAQHIDKLINIKKDIIAQVL